MRTTGKLVSLVIPVFDEEEAIPAFIERVSAVTAACRARFDVPLAFEWVFVNDGSHDDSLAVLLAAREADPAIRVLDLSRNFGKEAALTAGIDAARGDAVIPIDADLQDPPELIETMIARWLDGAEVVLARRARRDDDGFLKRNTARAFYRLHNVISAPKLPPDVGDFRLMDRAVVEALKGLPESRRFMKGLFAWIGFRAETVDYTRPPRVTGRGKFSGWKLWNFALEGITSFSTAPLRVWTYIGFLVSLLSFLFAAWIIFQRLFLGLDIPGYAALMTAVLFIGGVQLIGIGVLGEYLGRVYAEVKGRPVYIVRRDFGGED